MNALFELAEMLKASTYTIALTGAGISTESGIPDFRGSLGLYSIGSVDPDLLTVNMLAQNPEVFYTQLSPIVSMGRTAKPNQGHYCLAKLQEKGLVQKIATQNIDGLHQAAGSSDVIEIHGNMNTCSCLFCGRRYPIHVLQQFIAKGDLNPKSECCHATLRPDCVLFNDPMPPEFIALYDERNMIDFVLVIGTSLTVYPAADIPRWGRKFAIINRDMTPLDSKASLVINESIGETLAKLLELV